MISKDEYEEYGKYVIEPLKNMDFDNDEKATIVFIKRYIVDIKLETILKKLKNNKVLSTYIAKRFRNNIINSYTNSYKNEQNS